LCLAGACPQQGDFKETSTPAFLSKHIFLSAPVSVCSPMCGYGLKLAMKYLAGYGVVNFVWASGSIKSKTTLPERIC
jgi:hypothetical protein